MGIIEFIVIEFIVKKICGLLLWLLDLQLVLLLLLYDLLRVHVHIEVRLAVNWQAIGCGYVNIHFRFAPNHAPDQLVGLL